MLMATLVARGTLMSPINQDFPLPTPLKQLVTRTWSTQVFTLQPSVYSERRSSHSNQPFPLPGTVLRALPKGSLEPATHIAYDCAYFLKVVSGRRIVGVIRVPASSWEPYQVWIRPH
jgi:hypothetical protein